MYSLNMPVSRLRTKVRQEFERHRYVNRLPVVDMLLFRSHAEFQVCCYQDVFIIGAVRVRAGEELRGGIWRVVEGTANRCAKL